MERINLITKTFGKPISFKQGSQGEFYLSAEDKMDNMTIYLAVKMLQAKGMIDVAYCDIKGYEPVLVVFDK